MKVKMKTSLAAADFSYVPGDIVEVTAEVAEAWQENGLADIYVEEEKKVIKHAKARKTATQKSGDS